MKNKWSVFQILTISSVFLLFLKFDYWIFYLPLHHQIGNEAIKTEGCSVRLGVRTPGFHPGSRGSIPLPSTKNHFN